MSPNASRADKSLTLGRWLPWVQSVCHFAESKLLKIQFSPKLELYDFWSIALPSRRACVGICCGIRDENYTGKEQSRNKELGCRGNYHLSLSSYALVQVRDPATQVWARITTSGPKELTSKVIFSREKNVWIGVSGLKMTCMQNISRLALSVTTDCRRQFAENPSTYWNDHDQPICQLQTPCLIH